jgi:hypothetical protein
VKTEDLVSLLAELVAGRNMRQLMQAAEFEDLEDEHMAILLRFAAGERPEVPAFVAPVATFIRVDENTTPADWDDDELDRQEAQRILAAKRAAEERQDPTKPLVIRTGHPEIDGVTLP